MKRDRSHARALRRFAALMGAVAAALSAPTALGAMAVGMKQGTLFLQDQAGEANTLVVRIGANGGVEVEESAVGFNNPFGDQPESSVPGPPGAFRVLTYAAGAVTTIAIDTAGGADTFTIVDTAAGVGAIAAGLGDGADSAEIFDSHASAAQGTFVNGGAGADDIVVHNVHGTLLGAIGGGEGDRIELFDTNTTSATGTILGGEAGADGLIVHDAHGTALSVIGGDGDDDLTVTHTHTTGATGVGGEGGTDEIMITDAAPAVLIVAGGDGADVIALANTHAAETTQVLGDSDAGAMPGAADAITISDVNTPLIQVIGGPGNDDIALLDTHATSSTVVAGSGGADAITIGDAHGALLQVLGDEEGDTIEVVTTHSQTAIAGGAGADAITVADANGPALSVQCTDGDDVVTLRGLGLSGGLDAFFIDGEAGNDTVFIDGFIAVAGQPSIIAEATFVNAGAVLAGQGSVQGPVIVLAGGTLAPGASPGLLAMLGVAFDAGATYDVEIDGTELGVDHDSIIAIGGVVLGGATLALSGTWIPAGGDEIVIVVNDEADPVVGTFAGLPEGAPFLFNGMLVFITYAGGDGNDVVIFCPDDTVASPAWKGSLVYFVKVELRWSGTAPHPLIQDTFLSLTNDFSESVAVQLYFVNGDGPAPGHPGWNRLDNGMTLTANQPVYWSAATGQPAAGGLSPFTALDPSFPPGRPANDGTSDRVLRGFVVGWAVDATGQEIRWNHLAGNGTIVHYGIGAAWEYETVNVPVLADVPNGAPTDPVPGLLRLDGDEYAPAQDVLLFNFQAAGSAAFGPLGAPRQVITDTELTLMPLSIDLRQTGGLLGTKADLTIWNENEVKFSGLHRCVLCWDSGLISQYGLPNHFLRTNLQTDHGKARVDGVAAPQCPIALPAALAGVATRVLAFDPGMADQDVAFAGASLVGAGMQSAFVLYDVPGGGQESEAIARRMLPFLFDGDDLLRALEVILDDR
jgi:hypothetical protein